MKRITLYLFLLIPTFIFSQKIVDQDVPTKDITHNDDVIIIGSLNVGFDAVTNRNFGFDTQILSENNLRILFEDTSNSASFPTNDWRIVINDSSNGGEDHFSIEDVTGNKPEVFKIEAGANTHALVVSDNSRIGVGTEDPVEEIHTVLGNTPTLRLDQDNSLGFSPQVWDLAGNETNFFIRDVTNFSRLPFRIRPNAQTSSIDIMAGIVEINGASADVDTRIEGENDENCLFVEAGTDRVGIGTNTPGTKLHVVGDISKTGSLVGASDEKIKLNVKSIDNAMDLVNRLDGKSFEFDTESFPALSLPEGSQFGLIAQDVEQVESALVLNNFMKTEDKHGRTQQLKGVKYEQLIPVLINALKEQQILIEELRFQNQSHVSKMAELENKFAELEKAVKLNKSGED